MATFEEAQESGWGGRQNSGKGWLQDEKGRHYRLFGGCREYERREDRDAAVEETYRLTPVVRAVLGIQSGEEVFGAVLGNVSALSELFYQETAQWFGERSEWLDRWSIHHFGRKLEPAARMVLAYELRRHLALEDGGRKGPSAGAFETYAQERRFMMAAASVPDGPSFERVIAIAKVAGAKVGDGPYTMPSVAAEECV